MDNKELEKFLKSMLIGISRDITRVQLQNEELHKEIKEIKEFLKIRKE